MLQHEASSICNFVVRSCRNRWTCHHLLHRGTSFGEILFRQHPHQGVVCVTFDYWYSSHLINDFMLGYELVHSCPSHSDVTSSQLHLCMDCAQAICIAVHFLSFLDFDDVALQVHSLQRTYSREKLFSLRHRCLRRSNCKFCGHNVFQFCSGSCCVFEEGFLEVLPNVLVAGQAPVDRPLQQMPSSEQVLSGRIPAA